MSSDQKTIAQKIDSVQISSEISPNQETLPLQVVFILDVTGSMSNQIEGVKSMVATFCSYDRPGVNIHIWTYTETSTTCYVCKSKPGLSEVELVDYVFQIKLCCPPEFPNANASGGDGPENVVAAVTSLLHSFDPRYNIVCFIITDAAPHHIIYGESGEAKAEKTWLTEHGHNDHDIFGLLNEVIETLNITFVPVLYTTGDIKWYQQAAVLTQGCILCPNSSNSEILAKGLGSLLTTLQKISISREVAADEVANLDDVYKGFAMLDLKVDEFVPLDKDSSNRSDISGTLQKISNAEEIKASLLGLMETACDKFAGKKAGKRCRTVNPKIIAASVRILTMSMLDFIDSPLFPFQDWSPIP